MQLDIAHAVGNNPHDLTEMLRKCAEQFREDSARLQSDWLDPNAGRVWLELSKILDSAAARASYAIRTHW